MLNISLLGFGEVNYVLGRTAFNVLLKTTTTMDYGLNIYEFA